MGRAEPAPAEVLYRRGRTSTMCTLILTGKVVVLAGRDGRLLLSRTNPNPGLCRQHVCCLNTSFSSTGIFFLVPATAIPEVDK